MIILDFWAFVTTRACGCARGIVRLTPKEKAVTLVML